MNDPFGSMQNMVSQYRGFLRNPMQYFMQKRLNIPQNIANDPDAMIQHLMNNGQMSQGCYNQLQQMSQAIRNNPMFRNFMK